MRAETSPAKVWAALDPGLRALAARALYRHAWGEHDTRREADAMVAAAYRFREAMIRKLPAEQRADYLGKLTRVSDSLAGSLLLALHLEHRRPMLGAFLDALSVPHEDGLIDKDHELTAPDEALLQRAAELLSGKFPDAEVEVYLATLHALDPDVWGGVARILDRRPEAAT